ncbi:uncharacterized protein LOC126846972 [Adelges cooleyi]|uniref:uncharacterized protein LOC126846972 n=1 Tax=Adelges cooleyi TaxID=133065 RepID=UPI00217F9955|nr:uncharacterized protein LOC126846972 [Adelges cooleyi]
MSDKAMLVLGEAPESDDENLQDTEANKSDNMFYSNTENKAMGNDLKELELAMNYYGHTTMRGGRIRRRKEDHNEQADSFKMSEDTLLHRKLKEKNMQFYSNLSSLSKQMFVNAVNQINETDQQLVKAQVLLQDTVTSWKYIEQNLSHIKKKMTDILSEEYIPKVNI